MKEKPYKVYCGKCAFWKSIDGEDMCTEEKELGWIENYFSRDHVTSTFCYVKNSDNKCPDYYPHRDGSGYKPR